MDKSGPAAARYYHPTLIELFRRDSAAADGEVGAIGYDPICSCQDFEIGRVDVAAQAPRGEVLPVTARFRNLGQSVTVELRLMRTPRGWRIHDIGDQHMPSLRALIEGSLK